jgi:hypothetical protein
MHGGAAFHVDTSVLQQRNDGGKVDRHEPDFEIGPGNLLLERIHHCHAQVNGVADRLLARVQVGEGNA